MITLLATSLLASLAGSLHCAGMCGPLLALVQGGGRSSTRQAAYQAGRLASYATLGVAAGAVGHGVETLAALEGLTHAALALAAVALLITLVAPLLPPHHAARSELGFRAMRGALASATPLTRAALFGAATGLMPCGWLYGWLAVAAASGSPLSGGAVMLAFGLGSVPALVASNTVLAKTSGYLRRRARRLAPLMLAASAIAAIAMRAAVTGTLHDALDHGVRHDAPLVCHGG